jgi:3-hydroxybutyryl-CoA dehydrogenase
MNTKKIAIIGAGLMGSGIAQMALEAGFAVILVDSKQSFVDNGVRTITGFIGKKLAKKKIDQARHDDILSHLYSATDMVEAAQGAIMVVEAVFENIDLKKDIFKKLDAICPPDTILASNTSTLSISEIASVTEHPQRVVGTHYFSPVPLMRLVEVVQGDKTSDRITAETKKLCEEFGKTPIVVKDIPGFIVNRFLCLLYNEAANMIQGGAASAKDIDDALKLGCNWPMGIAEIMDMAGVDVTHNALKAMYAMTSEDRYNPSPLLEKMVAENHLGRKTQKGFYDYQ